MKKFVISLTHNTSSEKELHLTMCDGNLPPSKNFQRTSPVFLTNNTSFRLEDFKNGKLLLIYTLDTFFIIGRINHYLSENKKNSVFQTLGLGSILVFSEDSNFDFSELISNIGRNFIGFEIWNITEHVITLQEKKLKSLEKEERLNIDLSLLGNEDRIIINEIIPSFNFLQSFVNCYIIEYKNFSDELRKCILNLYFELLFLTKKITSDEFEEKVKNLFNSTESAKRNIESYNLISRNVTQVIARHFQLRDELIQISAILRTINTQAFYGLDCFDNGYTRTGNNSLFGTGLTYSAIFTLYEYTRNLFVNVISLKKIKEKYSDYPSPEFMKHPGDDKNWKTNLKKINRNLDVLNQSNDSDDFYHLLYFSNRLGYRETKRSISVAQQSMYLGFLPTWSLNTFTHEFTHAHVRGLLSITYPFKVSSENYIPQDIYTIYENRFNTSACDNLLDYIKAYFLIMVTNLQHADCISSSQTTGNHNVIALIDNLTKSTKRYYHEIDEIMVHILDFHYFYSATSEIYIKTIWASWLTLPSTLSRISEYLTRTIVAIASKINGDRNEQIKFAIDTVSKELTELEESEFVDSEQVNIVLRNLKSPEFKHKITFEFHQVWGQLIDIVLTFLYSNQLKDALNTDFFEEFNGSLIKDGEYNEFRIDSPIKFLNHLLYNSFYKKEGNSNDIDSIEANTAWMLSVLNSNLFNKNEH